MCFIETYRLTGNGSRTIYTGRFGSLTVLVQAGGLIPKGAGFILPPMAGIGSQMRLGGGRRFTMDAGLSITSSAGCGCQAPFGRPPGFLGNITMVIMLGLRYRPKYIGSPAVAYRLVIITLPIFRPRIG